MKHSELPHLKTQFEIAAGIQALNQQYILTSGLAQNARFIHKVGDRLEKYLPYLIPTNDIDLVGPWLPEMEEVLHCHIIGNNGKVIKIAEGGCMGYIKGIRIDMLLGNILYDSNKPTEILTPFGIPLRLFKDSDL